MCVGGGAGWGLVREKLEKVGAEVLKGWVEEGEHFMSATGNH